jgi:hypothetical protein
MAAQRNGFGVAGLVCGIVALVSSFYPITWFFTSAELNIGWYYVPIAICGIVLSSIGMSRVRQGLASNRGAARAGLVTSLVSIAMMFVWYMVVIVVLATTAP